MSEEKPTAPRKPPNKRVNPMDEFVDLKVKIAEVVVSMQSIAQDLRGALMSMKELATTRELEMLRNESVRNLQNLEKSNDERIKALEGVVTWGGRIVVGAVLMALLALVLNSKGVV